MNISKTTNTIIGDLETWIKTQQELGAYGNSDVNKMQFTIIKRVKSEVLFFSN